MPEIHIPKPEETRLLARRISGYLPMRIGSSPFFSAAPLNYGLGSNLKLMRPIDLAEQLRCGTLDMSLTPVAEILEHPYYVIADGYGVCGEGEAYSYILFLQKPLDDVRTIAVDSSAKTCIMLLQVLFRKFLGQEITIVPQGTNADAQLWIGDHARALRRVHPDGNYWDLSRAWQQYTSYPFIFSGWAMPKRRDNLPSANYIRQVAEEGLKARAIIASTPLEYKYLTYYIRYRIGEREKTGLRLFAKLAAELGLIEYVPSIEWV